MKNFYLKISKLFVIIFLLFIINSCFSTQHKISTWVLYDTEIVGKHHKVLHYFRSLGGSYGFSILLDSAVCKIGDTLYLSHVNKYYYILN